MKKALQFLIIFNIATICLANTTVSGLKCEYQSHPVGINLTNPRLSWVIESDQDNQLQSAYQVLVASNPKLLSEKKADCWNSEKNESDQSINVKYGGTTFESLTEYYWKVRIWDKNGKVTKWSPISSWTTGLISPDSFKGKWVTYSKPIDHEVYKNNNYSINLDNAKWIWRNISGDLYDYPPETLVFTRNINFNNTSKLGYVQAAISADDIFKLSINGTFVGSSVSWQNAKKIDIQNYLTNGNNLFEIEVQNTTKGPCGLICKINWKYDGKVDEIVSDSTWQVKKANNQSESAKEIAKFGDAPWNVIPINGQNQFSTQDTPSPLLRKEFSINKKIEKAYSIISGLGFYELRINGQKVGNKVLDPIFTNYDKTVLYSTYDITNMLQKGNNAVGIMLSNGWYNSHTKGAWNYNSAPWRDKPKALMDIVIKYTDGTTDTICTNDTWTGSNGPLVADAIRNGEVYDARLEQPGWDKPDFDYSIWDFAIIADAPKGTLKPEIMPGAIVHETIAPVAITEPQKGVYIIDIGVNISGWAKLKISGEPGQKITMRYGEKLKDGMLDTKNISGLTYSGPFQTDTYYLKGKGTEQWNPRFVYHGFRYIEVTGLKEKPKPDTIRAQFVYTNFKNIGTFQCSNELFNTIQEITDRSYKSNFVGLPTDCPHREKNGWTADAHLAAELAMFNYENVPAYEKWLRDFKDDQDKDGRYSCIIPSPGWGARDLTEWDSAYIIIAWYLYKYHNDTQVIEDNYENMKKYMENVARRIGSSYIVTFGLGDWCNDFGAQSPNQLTATAYFYYDTVIMKKFAEILGKSQDVDYFNNLSANVKKAYNNKFYKGNGIYVDGQQTCLAMSLFYDLVEESQREAVQNKLVEAIQAADNHHDVGILGAKCIFRVLCDMGRNELAFTTLNQKTMPSYGYWIENGATSLYENWSLNPGSMNHIMFGDISAWFFSCLGGINADPTQPGFKRTIIKPAFTKGIDWVATSYLSPYGQIQSNWKFDDSNYTCQLEIPANTEAIVILDSSNPESISCSKDFKKRTIKNSQAIFTIGSGKYTFNGIK